MIYLKETWDTTIWAIWKIQETEMELAQLLDNNGWYQNIFEKKSEKRRLEMLAVRALLKEICGQEKEIRYLTSGKPILSDQSYFISISHTKQFVAICLDKDKPVAIDLEYRSDKVLKVKSRIVPSLDVIVSDKEQIHLLLYWTVKEALYKYIDDPNIDLIKDLHVNPFVPEGSRGYFTAYETITKKRQIFDAFYYVSNDFVMTVIK